MHVLVECALCGAKNVVNVSYNLNDNEFVVENNYSYDEFLERYLNFVRDLTDFPIKKERLIKLIRCSLNVNGTLAYEILDKLKNDLYLYEKDGMIYEVL